MKKLMATVFCAALTLPAMQAMAQSDSLQQESPANTPTGHGQEFQGSKATSGSTGMKDSHSSTDTDQMSTGRQGHSDPMQQDLHSPNGNGKTSGAMSQPGDETGDAAGVTDTGRQGHSAEMEEKVAPGDPTENGDSMNSQ